MRVFTNSCVEPKFLGRCVITKTSMLSYFFFVHKELIQGLLIVANQKNRVSELQDS